MKPARAAIAVALAVAATAANAGRPLVTEDAQMQPHGACQLETWLQRAGARGEGWAHPGCNPLGAFELSVAAAVAREDGANRLAYEQLQVKIIPREVGEHPWGAGIVIGTTRDRRIVEARRGRGNPYLVVPVSFAGEDEAWRVHVNTGVQRLRETRETLASWALAMDLRVAPSLYVHPEIYRSERGRPFCQLGVSYEAAKDRVRLDASYGDRAAFPGRERWFSVGVTFHWPEALAR